MMKRTIIKIDENVCNGCGNCVAGCHEGALQLIDGKAVMISDLYCDGLGACIGECPVGAITLEEREAEKYDEIATLKRMLPRGEKVVLAHLKHMKDHNQHEWLKQGVEYLQSQNSKIPLDMFIEENKKQKTASQPEPALPCGCPGSMARSFDTKDDATDDVRDTPSALRQWPVQLHLLSPLAPYLKKSDLLLAADCTAFALGNFHQRFLKGKSLAIACPKLDSNQDLYVEKLTAMIDEAEINTLTVAIMEVPCCGGLLYLAKKARDWAHRNIPIKLIMVGVQGDILKEEWV